MRVPPLQRQLGGLQTLVVPGGDPNGLVVIALHGFGADNQDLLGLAEVVRTPPGTTWVFPNAPLEVPIGPHMTGRAWFPIDMVALQTAMMAGGHVDLSTIRPPGLEVARAKVEAMLAELGVPWNRLVLLGFSQGAMVATAVACQAPQSPAALVLLSSTPVDHEAIQALAPCRAGLRFFQSHGTFDPLLGYQHAQRLHTTLTAAGLQGEFVGFQGEHEIPPQVLTRLGQFLTGLAA